LARVKQGLHFVMAVHVRSAVLFECFSSWSN